MTIAQQLNIKEFPFEIKDKKGNVIYFEDSYGIWKKYNYNSRGYEIYHENSYGYKHKREFDSRGKLIYTANSFNGVIMDNRPNKVELTIKQIGKKLIDIVKLLKTKS